MFAAGDLALPESPICVLSGEPHADKRAKRSPHGYLSCKRATEARPSAEFPQLERVAVGITAFVLVYTFSLNRDFSGRSP
ncbi:rCG43976 [Rattus norvegicus]|uniref:RCG43976 n=1 Tax=Rattus norvegicus TaxID=10116 RepID=A6J735_RAT|nr:rCG43976 [Rattus norvegicus]